MIADTPANRRSLTTAIGNAFRKMKFKKGEHRGERVFDVEREATDEIVLSYQPGGIIGKEHYTVRVRSVDLGGTFVGGPHRGMAGEIEDIAREAKFAWQRSHAR